jgi:beta-barrel assembly-enhancing protease
MNDMKRNIKALLLLMVLPALIMTMACDPEDKTINIFTIQDDIALGNQVAAEIASDPAKFPVLSRAQYPAAYEHLDRIMNTILATKLVAYDTVFPWTTYIIKDDNMVNAFATPGGHLYFYTGLIKELENEAQLAGVMAHEMAHCSRRHSTDQLTRYYGLSLLVAIVLGENPSMLKQLAADIASGLAALAFSRKMEYEADDYAVKYLSSTDYHPLGLADFFIKMEGLPQPPTFLSTHPSPEDRIDKINQAWVANGSKVGDYFEVRYQSFKAVLP